MAALHHTLPATAAPPLRIRDLGPADEPLIDELHEALSAQSRYQRFHGPKPRLAPRERAYLAATDGRDHVALVAQDGHGATIAIARFVRLRDRPQAADIAAEVVGCAPEPGHRQRPDRPAARRAAAVGVCRFRRPCCPRRACGARSCGAAGRSSRPTGRAPRSRSTCGRCSAPAEPSQQEIAAGCVAAAMRTRLSDPARPRGDGRAARHARAPPAPSRRARSGAKPRSRRPTGSSSTPTSCARGTCPGRQDAGHPLDRPVLQPLGPGRRRPAPSRTRPTTPSALAGPSDRFKDFVDGAKLMQRGYTFVMVDLRGFGGSTGCLDWGGPGEQADVVKAVEWAATASPGRPARSACTASPMTA